MIANPALQTHIDPRFVQATSFQVFSADSFPTIHPVHWLHSHFAVGGWSPLQRISGMLTAHMTQIAPHNGFTWHPHRGLEIYTWVLDGTLYHEDTTGGKGYIEAGELQRMFSGNFIQHQELNRSDEPARVIQIWYVADPQYRAVEPHYQQVSRDELPAKTIGDATIFSLIGNNSPMESHITGRLTATVVEAGGTTTVELPHEDEDLFLYITDAEQSGIVKYDKEEMSLDTYDVILASPDAHAIQISASESANLQYLSFYLPTFIQN